MPGIVCNDCLKAQGKFCGGCRSCAGCLEKEGVKLCAECDWCDACVKLKFVEWETRKNERANEDDGEGFFMSRACKHHVPEYWKTVDFKLERKRKARMREKMSARNAMLAKKKTRRREGRAMRTRR